MQFTCNECGERSQRLINRLAYEQGLVFVQVLVCSNGQLERQFFAICFLPVSIYTVILKASNALSF